MNKKKLIFSLFFLILTLSCDKKEIQSNDSASIDSINSSFKKAEIVSENSLEAGKEISTKEQVLQFNEWFMAQNKPFVDLTDSISHSGLITLNEGEEWDGTILDYNKNKKSILEPLKGSIKASTFFTNAFKKRLESLLNDPKSNKAVLNLPTLLLNDENAFHLSGIFFDQLYDVNKRKAELGADSRRIDLNKRFIPSNSKLVLCNTGYNLAIEGSSIILVYINENGAWKISDIFFESELFE